MRSRYCVYVTAPDIEAPPCPLNAPNERTRRYRGPRVNRTYGTHKNLHISLFSPTIFRPIKYAPPVITHYLVGNNTPRPLIFLVGGKKNANARRCVDGEMPTRSSPRSHHGCHPPPAPRPFSWGELEKCGPKSVSYKNQVKKQQL